MSRLIRPLGISLVVTLLPLSADGTQGANSEDVVKRLDGLEQAVRNLEKQLTELNALLRAGSLPPAPFVDVQPFQLTLANTAVKGSPNAKLAIIEYSDFQCPFCARHASTVYKELQRELIDTGKIQYVFRNFPIAGLHPHAVKAAEAAECAREEGKFWEMRDQLFANQHALTQSDLIGYARAVAVDESRFQSCLVEGKLSGKVKEDLAEARRAGLTGTPGFLIGEIDAAGTVRVTRKIIGTHPFAVFQAALQGILQEPAKR